MLQILIVVLTLWIVVTHPSNVFEPVCVSLCRLRQPRGGSTGPCSVPCLVLVLICSRAVKNLSPLMLDVSLLLSEV